MANLLFKKPLNVVLAALLLVSISVSSSIVFAQEEVIGRVISSSGDVQAISSTGDSRSLSRRSEIFLQDTIVTGPDGFAQLRLIDTGMIAFKADTEFTFEEYSFDGGGGAADNAVMNLVRGGFRSISGTIGDDDQDNYRIDTPFASIGIRGTNHEAIIDGNSLLTGVYDGGTTISNNAGTLDTGIDSNFDYSQTQQGQQPVGLLQQPDQLGQIDLNPGTGAANNNGNDDADTTDDNADGNNPPPADGGDGNDDGGTGNNGGNDDGPPDFANAGGGDNDGAGGNPPAVNPAAGAPGAGGNGGGLDTGTNPGNDTTPDINPVVGALNQRDLETAGDSEEQIEADRIAAEARTEADRIAAEAETEANRIAAEAREEADRIADEAKTEAERIAAAEAKVEADRIADEARAKAERIADEAREEADRIAAEAQSEADRLLALIIIPVLDDGSINRVQSRLGLTLGRNISQGVVFPGNTSDINDSGPFILIGNDQEFPRSVDASPNFIFAGNANAGLIADGIDSANGEFTHDVQFGLWGSSSNPVSLFTDFTDNSVVQSINASFLWASVLPSPIANLVGEHHFTTTSTNFVGGSSLGGALKDLFVSFNVDFDSPGIISDGYLEFCIGIGTCNQHWEVGFSGNVREGFVVASPTTDTYINGDDIPILGLIDGAFTGFDPDAFAGGFNLYSNPGSGSEIIAAKVDGLFLIEHEHRISNYEILSLENDSLLVQEGYARTLLGNSRSTSSNSILFRDGISSPNLIIRDNGTPAVTISQINQNIGDGVYFGINWERWDGPLNTYTDNYDESIFINGATDSINDIAFFSTFETSSITNLQGSFYDVLGYIGEGDNVTDITALELEFDVDFFSGIIDAGRLSIDVGSSAENWLIYFDGTTYNNNIEFNILAHEDGESENVTRLFRNGFYSDFENFEGSFRGAFVNDGDIEETAAIVSFYFKDTSSDPNFMGEAVSGQAIVGGYVENRFSFVEEESLTNLGFVLPTLDSSIYNALANSGEMGRPIFVQNDPSDGVSFNLLQPRDTSYVFRQEAGSAIVLPFENYDAVLGRWDADSSSKILRYNNNVNLDNVIEYENHVFWASVNTQPLDTPFSVSSVTFANTLNGLGDSSDGVINEIESFFDIDLATGIVTGGFLRVCAGGGSYCDTDNGATIFEISFTGSMNDDGYFQSDTITSAVIFNDGNEETVNLSGEFHGVFTGIDSIDVGGSQKELYDAFVGGFNFLGEDSANDFLTGTFLQERDDRFTVATLNDVEYNALILDPSEGSTGFFESTTTSNIDGLHFFSENDFEPNTSIPDNIVPPSMSLALYGEDAVVRLGDSNDESRTQTNVGGFDLTWAQWEGSTQILDESLNPEYLLGQGINDLTSPIFWAIFDSSRPPANTGGTFKTIISGNPSPFLASRGSSVAGTTHSADMVTFLDIEFDVDFNTGIISNGYFDAEVNGGSASGVGSDWMLQGFGGQVSGADVVFGFVDNDPGETNDYGTLTASSAPTAIIDSAVMIGSFIDDNEDDLYGEDEGFVGSFFLGASSADQFLDGIYLAKIASDSASDDQRLSFLDLDTEDFDDFGFALFIDTNSRPAELLTTITSNSKLYENAIINETTLLEIDSFSNPESIGDIFTQDGSFLSNLEYDASYYHDGGITWGIWSTEAGIEDPSPLAYTNPNDPFETQPAADAVLWATINDPVISTYSGSATYSNVLFSDNFIGAGADSSIENITVAFDVDFSSSMAPVSNGFIEVCVGNSSDCYAEVYWEVTFDGSVSDGHLIASNIMGTRSTNYGETSSSITDAAFNGLFTGNDYDDDGYTADPYSTFLGGFTFTEMISDDFVTGAFIVNKESSLSAEQVLETKYGDYEDVGARALVNITGIDNYYSQGFYNSLGSPTSNPNDVFFYRYDNCVECTPAIETVEFYQSFSEHSATYVNSDDDFFLTMGAWQSDGTNGLFAYSSPYHSSEGYYNGEASFSDPAFWASYSPTTFASMTARFSQILDDFGTYKAGNGSLHDIDVLELSFDVDFLVGDISNGNLKIEIFNTGTGSDHKLLWLADFSGNYDMYDGLFYTDIDSVYFAEFDSIGNIVTTTQEDELQDEINIDFTGDDYQPIAVGSYLLNGAEPDSFVAGIFAAGGYLEDRLTIQESEVMETRIGIIAEHGSELSVLSAASSDSNTGIPKIGINFIAETQTPLPYNSLGIHDGPFDIVISDDTPGSYTPNIAGFDVDWGIWNSMDISTQYDHTDAGEVSHQFNTDLIWASVQPSEIMDLEGDWYLYGTNDYLGTAEDGAVTSFEMYMHADLANGFINDGYLHLETNGGFQGGSGSGTDWFLNFGGAISGARAQMDPNSFANESINNIGATIAGDINGVFTGTGDTLLQQGFVAGYSLQSGPHTVQGVGLLQGIVNPTPP